MKTYTKVNTSAVGAVLSMLKPRQTYYLRIRTFKTTAGKTFYSSWTKPAAATPR